MITPDRKTIIQIFGSLMCRPSLLSDIDKYQLEPNDFPFQLDRFIFSAIYNLYIGGAESIHTIDIDTYLQDNALAKDLIEKENGIQFLQDCENFSDVNNFSYYYKKLKKINLLRELEKQGKDISQFYCEDSLNPDYIKINSNFEKLTTDEIVNKLKGEIAALENKYVLNSTIEEDIAFNGIKDLIKELQDAPEIGVRLQGDIFNTISRGGRKGKLYLRSASSGTGKTRSMVGDACNIAYPIRYEPAYGKWISTGMPEKVLYVATEQELSEIKTMILAYLTGYNEEIFLYGTFGEEHKERIDKALQIMEMYKDNLMLVKVPDPCSSIIKNLFRKYNFQYGIENFFFDYVFSSPSMLNEYRDLAIREDVALRLFVTALKNLATELNVFILTATQISNDDDKAGGFRDYRNIRGSRAVVDLVDLACIMSRPTKEELKLVEGFQKSFNFQPDCVIDVFKNRRGRWTQIRIWSKNDLGTCRRYDLFATTANMRPIEDFQIVDFVSEKPKDLVDLEKLFNDGEVSDDIEEKLIETFIPERKENLLDEVTKAFGNQEEKAERLKNTDWSELI